MGDGSLTARVESYRNGQPFVQGLLVLPGVCTGVFMGGGDLPIGPNLLAPILVTGAAFTIIGEGDRATLEADNARAFPLGAAIGAAQAAAITTASAAAGLAYQWAQSYETMHSVQRLLASLQPYVQQLIR